MGTTQGGVWVKWQKPMTQGSNGRVALEHAIAGVDKVYTSCTALARETPTVPELSNCPNHKFSKPWYMWATSANKAILEGVAELALWRKDDLKKALEAYDEAKSARDTQSGITVVSKSDTLEIPVPYSVKTIKVPKSMLVWAVIIWIALVTFGIDPLVYFRVKQHDKARIFNTMGSGTNLVVMEVVK